jgi:hypothetical protein
MNAVTDAVAGHMNAVVTAVVTAFTLRSPGLRGGCCWRIEPLGAGLDRCSDLYPLAERPVEAPPHASTRA